MKKSGKEFTSGSPNSALVGEQLRSLQSSLLPQFGPNWHRHSLVTLRVEALSRLLHYAELYELIIEVPGVICEFGVQWGATMAELINLRSIFEPFNVSRIIYGFDTFSGFTDVDKKDGGYSEIGDYASLDNYIDTLDRILSLHEEVAPLPHIKKFELIKGDASITIDRWLADNQHAIISMAIFDMDLYKPTKDVLEKIIPRLTNGSLLVFDELNCKYFPGETAALRELIGLGNLKLRRSTLQPYCSWAVWGNS